MSIHGHNGATVLVWDDTATIALAASELIAAPVDMLPGGIEEELALESKEAESKENKS